MPLDLATVTKEDKFDAHLGTRFVMRASAEHAIEVELLETSPLPSAPNAKRASFLLRFRASEPRALPQRIYALEHAALGTFELFLVPCGPDTVGMRYDAVFG